MDGVDRHSLFVVFLLSRQSINTERYTLPVSRRNSLRRKDLYVASLVFVFVPRSFRVFSRYRDYNRVRSALLEPKNTRRTRTQRRSIENIRATVPTINCTGFFNLVPCHGTSVLIEPIRIHRVSNGPERGGATFTPLGCGQLGPSGSKRPNRLNETISR